MRTILHIAVANNWRIEQYDVKTAFLNGILPDDEVQYMEQPPSFHEPGMEDYVWMLQCGLYGMRQASCIWNKMLHALFLEWGFKRLDCKWCVYYCHSNSSTTFVAIHVDDMIAASSCDTKADCFRAKLELKWQISALGEAKHILGITLHHDRVNQTITLHQTVLLDKLISTFGQADAKPVSTPIAHGALLI